jgi:hypothetical protein
VEGHPFRDAPQRRLPSARVKTASARLRDFALIGVFTLIWNTIVGVIYFGSWADDGFGGLHLFLSLFVLAGLGMLALTTRAFLSLFNPTVELYVSEPNPALGETIDIRWHLTGKPGRVRSLVVEFIGAEVAVYKRGTDTTTDHHVFFRAKLAHTDVAREIADGTATIVIPAGAVPTFNSTHNSILWKVVFKGEIPWWPDIDDGFPIEVVASTHHRNRQAA